MTSKLHHNYTDNAKDGCENIDFKGLAEAMNRLIFNNLHNPPPKKYFDIIIKPLYLKQLLNLVLGVVKSLKRFLLDQILMIERR
jgi:hypothetical protein